MCPATSLPRWSWGHQLAKETVSQSAQKRTDRGLCPLRRQLSFRMRLAGLLCQSASKDSGCVRRGFPPARFCFRKKHGHARGRCVPRSHPAIWAEDNLGAHQMTITTGVQWRAPTLQQSHRKLPSWRRTSGGFGGKGNAETYRAAHWRGSIWNTREKGGDYSTRTFLQCSSTQGTPNCE